MNIYLKDYISIWLKPIGILLLLLLQLSTPVSAQEEPFRVYRVDSRQPGTIFQAGFSPWGHNFNLYSHILGWGCKDYSTSASGTIQSAYISTTTDSDVAKKLALKRLTRLFSGPNPPYAHPYFYVYDIDTNHSFFSILDTLQAALQDPNIGYSASQHELLLQVVHTYGPQLEVASQGHIPPASIHGAWQMNIHGEVVGYETNPNYMPSPHYDPGVAPNYSHILAPSLITSTALYVSSAVASGHTEVAGSPGSGLAIGGATGAAFVGDYSACFLSSPEPQCWPPDSDDSSTRKRRSILKASGLPKCLPMKSSTLITLINLSLPDLEY